MQNTERLYHVVAINQNTRSKIYMTARPCTHQQAMTIISKISTIFKWRRIQVEDAQLA